MSTRLIVVDGLDGCGKDTHAERMREFLEAKGERVSIVSHPSERLFGRLSKRSLQGSGPVARLFASLFFTADVLMSVRWYRRQRPGGVVIFVRYLLGTAYLPAALAPSGYQLFRKLLPFPNLAFFIDIEPEVAIRRIVARGHKPEMFETRDRIAAVRAVAKRLVSQDWVIVDNSEDGERPFRDVEKVLETRFPRSPPPR
ncbi:MAG: thymidylate kinase [Thermoplasmata archaeon]